MPGRIRPVLVWLTVAALAAESLWSCAGGPSVQQIAPQKPYAVLPDGARVVFGFRPMAIAPNPLIAQLSEALGAQAAPLPYTRTIRQLGIDPQTQVENGCWAMYSVGLAQQGAFAWVLALTGDVGEARVLEQLTSPADPRLQATLETKSFQNTPFYAVSRGAAMRSDKVYLVFLAPNVMLAANTENLAQHAIAVWRGKADSLMESKDLAPLLKQADTSAAVWCAGHAEGTLTLAQLVADNGLLGLGGPSENLGRGVGAYRGALHLSAQEINLEARFECDNANAAAKQRTNYETYAKAKAQSLARGVLGASAAKDLYAKLQLQTQESSIEARLVLTQNDLEALTPKIAEGREQLRQLNDMLRRRMEQGAAGQPPEQTPAPEESPAP